jgi:hypothetical protein
MSSGAAIIINQLTLKFLPVLILPAWLNSHVTVIPQQQEIVNSCFFSFLQHYISRKNPANKKSKKFSG